MGQDVRMSGTVSVCQTLSSSSGRAEHGCRGGGGRGDLCWEPLVVCVLPALGEVELQARRAGRVSGHTPHPAPLPAPAAALRLSRAPRPPALLSFTSNLIAG